MVQATTRRVPMAWFALFFFLHIEAQWQAAEPSPSVPWYYSAGSPHFPQLFATDLQDDTFEPVLANSTDEYVLVDFYAPWCPHCQHFAPDYERLSLAIRQMDEEVAGLAKAPHPGVLTGKTVAKTTILSATLDCVRYARTCQFWGVQSFPTLMWGRRADWLERSASKLVQIDVDRTADNVAFWINNRTNSSLNPSHISKAEMNRMLLQHRAASNTSPVAGSAGAVPEKTNAHVANGWDVQLALALWLRQIFDNHAFQRRSRDEHHSEDEADHSEDEDHSEDYASSEEHSGVPHKALFDLVDVLAVRFPEVSKGGSCRQSLVALQDRLRHNLTSVVEPLSPELVKFSADRLESEWRLCDTDWTAYSSGWRSCRGTWPGKRGFTCGLWNMFHVLAAQSDDNSALSDLLTLRNAVKYFFDCEECRDHFAQIPAPQGTRTTRKEAQLWWWRAHNKVNTRVQRLEEQYEDGDPGFPKVQWPTEAVCPTCRSSLKVPAGRKLAAVPKSSPRTLSLRGSEGAALSIASANFDVVTKTTSDWNISEVRVFLDQFYGRPSQAA